MSDALSRQEAEIRWHMIETRAVNRRGFRGPQEDNSREFYRVLRSVQTMAGRLVDGFDEADSDAFERLFGDLWDDIRERLIAFATEEDGRRAEARRWYVENGKVMRTA